VAFASLAAHESVSSDGEPVEAYEGEPVEADEGEPVEAYEGEPVEADEGEPVEADEAELVEADEGEPVGADEAELVAVPGDSASAQSEPSAVTTELAVEAAVSGDSEVSELPPGVVAGASPRPIPTSITPAAPRYTRKSDVSELLRNFSVADPEPSRSLLRDLKGLAGLEPSKTPPPVAVSLADDTASEEQKTEARSIRPIATVTVVGTFLCVAAFAGPRVVSAHAENATQAAAAPAPATPLSQPSPCTASLGVVGAPSDARIEVRPLNPGSSVEPQWASGPEATFSQLPCAKPFEVLVRSGADETRYWTRVPISAAELTPASPRSAGVQLAVDLTRRELY
jgi:hypothetical protein